MIPALDSNQTRLANAERVRHARDIQIPTLDLWNYGPCSHHDVPRPDCEYRACGGPLWAHQRVGVSWLYVRRKGLLADGTGTGKTNQVYGLLALLKQRSELTGRALVVCQTPAAAQWVQEGARWVPGMHVEAALSGMTRQQRIERYTRNWDVLVMGYHLMLKDVRMLEKLSPDVLIVDDVDPLLDHNNKTHKDLELLSRSASRVVVINATTIQIRLQQLHAALTLIDGRDVFGTLSQFERRHILQEPVTIWTKGGRKRQQMVTTGFQHLDELKQKLSPMVLRRTDSMLDDVNMPTIMPPTDVWLELHPAQRAKYDQLQKDVLRLMNEEHAQIKHVTALTKVGYGQRICSGLPALSITRKEKRKGRDGKMKEYTVVLGHEPDGPEASSKLDWVMGKLAGEWRDEKIVAFIKNKGLLEALEARLVAQGIGSAKIWGDDSSATYRQEEMRRFWEDPKCQVMMGTAAIERSLNLQVSNKLVFVDTTLNPARVQQTVGRVQRAGSRHKHVYIFNLLCRDTQEEKYKHVLETRQALIDHVWDDTSELFEQLTPMQLLQLIHS